MNLSEIKDSNESLSKAAEKAESLWGKVEKAAKFVADRHYIPAAIVERVENVGAIFKTTNKYLGYAGNAIAGAEVQQWLAGLKTYDAAATNSMVRSVGNGPGTGLFGERMCQPEEGRLGLGQGV